MQCRFFLLIAVTLLSQKLCFGALQLTDFPGQGSVPFGEHFDGVNAFFKIFANTLLLKL